MATAASTMQFLLEQLTGMPQVTSRKMFGEYCLYINAKPVALVCDDTLYIKQTPLSDELLVNFSLQPPYPSAKNHYAISADYWEDADWLMNVLRQIEAITPLPKPKKPKMKPTAKLYDE